MTVSSKPLTMPQSSGFEPSISHWIPNLQIQWTSLLEEARTPEAYQSFEASNGELYVINQQTQQEAKATVQRSEAELRHQVKGAVRMR